MKQEVITTKNLIADEGYVLTNGNDYCKKVSLASGDSGEGWYEITEAEYNAYLAEQESVTENII